jgi:integrase/recombinase XerD
VYDRIGWCSVIVQRVVMPVSEAESWTVLRDDGSLVEPVESFLAYLAALERSPNTQRAYATSLKLWFEFLDIVDIAWSEVTVDDVARFVAWLRAPAPNVIVLDGGTARRLPATVNRHLAAVFGFYEHHARTGVEVAAGLVAWKRIGRGSYKPFLHHVTGGRPIATRPVKLPVPRRAPRTLTAEQLVRVLAAPVRARDRFLLALLAETGVRVGQALGLRHADFVSRAKEMRIVPRADNANGARAKLRSPVTVPVTAGLVRCYSDYMHTEYGELDSDYVFVSLWGGRIGSPLTYAAVHKMVDRIRAATGVDFTLHMLRHTHATELIRSGVAIEVVARLLTHRSSFTTSQIYIHLDVEDVREALHRAGVWDRCQPGEDR